MKKLTNVTEFNLFGWKEVVNLRVSEGYINGMEKDEFANMPVP